MILPRICKKSPSGEMIYYTWFQAMHTRIDVAIVSCEAEAFLNEASQRIYHRILDIEHTANCFDENSEISIVNRQAHLGPMTLSDELYHILSLCMKYNKLTFGLFDITTDSEGFTRETITHVALTDERKIKFDIPGIRLNLSGFLKGYALESIRSLLKECNIENALINMGNSSIMALGRPHSTQKWAISHHMQNTEPIQLENECLTTSGNDIDTRLHIVNPRTGKTIEGRKCTSLVTKSGIEGEVLSTALFIASDEDEEAILQRFHVDRIFHLG